MPTKILAIDDSKTMRLAIKITFAAEDAEVVAVSKGSEAVARAKQMGADVVLVDHTLADGEPSGFDVVRSLKSDSATAKTPVLMLVPGRGGVSDGQVSECGAAGSIGKPFDTQQLIDKVAAAVAGKPVGTAVVPKAAPAAAPKSAPAPAAKPKPAAAPVPAAKPKPAPAPAARPKPASAPTPAAKPQPAPAKRPPSGPGPAARPPSGPRPAAAPAGDIPIAVPIPFTAAGAPTQGMLARLEKAGGGAAAGLDPAAVKALLALSKEVVEQVVWEVVPDLAEEIIKQNART